MEISITSDGAKYIKYAVSIRINNFHKIIHNNLGYKQCEALVLYYISVSDNLELSIEHDNNSKSLYDRSIAPILSS